MTVSNMPHRSFLDVKEVETTADLSALRDALSEAARDAEKLGLADVKEHLDMALVAIEKAGIRSNTCPHPPNSPVLCSCPTKP